MEVAVVGRWGDRDADGNWLGGLVYWIWAAHSDPPGQTNFARGDAAADDECRIECRQGTCRDSGPSTETCPLFRIRR